MANKASGGAGNRRSQKDKEMAAELRRRGVVRVTQRCPNCYRIVACESVRSRYTHVCRG